MRLRWRVCEKLGADQEDIRLLQSEEEVLLQLGRAFGCKIPGSVFCWNKFLQSKDNCSFEGYFKTGLDAAR